MAAWVVLVYGIMVAAGGVMGYAKAKSTASLIAGGVYGALLLAAFVMMRGAQYAPSGWWLALIVALLLLGRFAGAARKGFKLMPGGMVIIASVITLVVLLLNRH